MSSGEVKPASTASFVIWVWTVKAAATDVSVKTSVAAATGLGSPNYVVCPQVDGDACKIGTVLVGQMDELQVAVRVERGASLGGQVQVTSKVTGHGANSFSGSAADLIVAAPKKSKSTPPVPPIPTPPPVLPTPPPIPSTGVSSTNPAGLFPTITATPDPSSSGNLGLPPAGSNRARASDDAATVPLDAKLIGGQLAGLAVLAGAVTIAITRLSLRRQPQPQAAQQSGDAAAAGPPSES